MLATTATNDPAPAISIPVGITIGLIASFVQSLGLTIQRKSHVLNQGAPEREQRVEHRRPLWLLGFGIFISSNILGSIFQIASLPVVILAPLGAVSLLWNALFARFILGDLFSKFMVLGTLLIVAGAVLIARFGIVPEPTHSLEDLLDLFSRHAFVVYFTLLGTTLLLVLVATHFLEWSIYRRYALESRSMSSSGPSSRSSTPIPLTPSNRAVVDTTERTPLLDPDSKPAPSIASSFAPTNSPIQKYRRAFNLMAVAYASASGTLSGMCLLFAKSGVELLLLSVSGHNQFWRWESWALVGGLVVFALLQPKLWYLHKSLVLADPTLVCPLAFCFYNVSSIINGLIYYNQLDALTSLQLGLVILGIAVLLAGVWAVSIQTDEEGGVEGGVRGGDWIPADEEGIAPAVAPVDLVRVAERATNTAPGDRNGLVDGLSTPPRRSRALSYDSHTSPPRRRDTSDVITSSPVQESFPPLDTSPLRHKPTEGHRRVRSSHTQIPQISTPVLPRYSLLSPESPTHVLPGFSIGISAVSPGFIAGTRRRSELPTPSGSGPRRTVSEGAPDGLGLREGSRSSSREFGPGHRRGPSSLSAASDEVEAALRPPSKRGSSPLHDAPSPRAGWLWRLLPWAVGRRKPPYAEVEGRQ
ncbi:hypothetical protein FRB99_001331 [Tulasnella sp. 403]|nr:hypothetical protein FRB99_001331 [Tulasnella sp. 403]